MTEKLSKKTKEFYQFASLSKYSLRERFLIRLADLVFYTLINLIGKTVKVEVEGWENFQKIEQAGKIPIYTFWHDRIFLGTYFFRDRGIMVMSSQSFDSEYTARVIQRFGYGTIKGSSTRGGVRALTTMIRQMRNGMPMGFTLDGPKGPRYAAKSGACLLAKKTGNPIMPFVFEPKNFWTINSWDKMQIPKPFTRAKLFIAEPIYIEKDADDKEIENKRRELQSKLDELVAFGKQWRDSII